MKDNHALFKLLLTVAFALASWVLYGTENERKLPTKSVVNSSLLKAPNSIPAGETGNVLFTLENPTSDTLRLILFPEIPEEWLILNAMESIALPPKSKKTIVYLLVPGQFAKVGLQKLIFNFIDVTKNQFIEQEVQINVGIKHLITVEQLDKNKAIAKESEGLELNYTIENKGNTQEIISISSWEYEKTENHKLQPGEIVEFSYRAIVPKNRTSLYLETGLRIASYTSNRETKIDEIHSMNRLRILEYGAYQTKSKSYDYPLTLSTEYDILERNVLEQRFTQKVNGLFPGLNKNDNYYISGNYRNIQLGSRNINFGGFILGYKSLRPYGLKLFEVGNVNQGGDFYFRMRNNFIGSKATIEKDDFEVSFGIHQNISLNPLIDTISQTGQIKITKDLTNVEYYTQTTLFNTKHGLGSLSKIGGLYNSKVWDIKHHIIYYQSPEQVPTLEALATESNISYTKKYLYGQFSLYASGDKFAINGRDMLSTQQQIRKQIDNFSFTLFNSYQENGWRQEISKFSSRSSSINTQFSFLDNFDLQVKARNSVMTSHSLGKVYINSNNSFNTSAGFRTKDLTLLGGWGYQEQSFGGNANPWKTNSFSAKADYDLAKSWNIGLNCQEQVMEFTRRRNVGGHLTARFGRKYSGSLRHNWLYQPDLFVSNQHTTQAQFKIKGRRNNASIGLSLLADDRGRRQFGLSLGASAQIATFNKDTIAYKKLEIQVISPSGDPMPNIVITIDGAKYITNNKGIAFAYNLTGNDHVYSIDKGTLPFGLLPEGGSTFKEVIYSTKKVERIINLYQSSTLLGSLQTYHTGLLKSSRPEFIQYIALLETSDGVQTTRVDKNGNFRFDGLAKGDYRLRIKDLNADEDGWELYVNSQGISITNEIENVTFDIHEIDQNIQLQQKIPILRVQ